MCLFLNKRIVNSIKQLARNHKKQNKKIVAKSNEIMALAKVLDTFLIVPPSLSVVSGQFSDAFEVDMCRIRRNSQVNCCDCD